MLFWLDRNMKVYLTTLGCKLNESELEAWAREFTARGDELVADPRDAETIVLNTCTVTAQAARKSRNTARHLARGNPGAQIVLTGCYATMAPDQARALPNVTLVVPNPDKDELVRLSRRYAHERSFELVANGCRLPEAASGDLASCPAPPMRGGAGGEALLRTRAFVKIEDGCNMSCTYCIIPLARGRARSRPQDELVAEIAQLVAAGYQEVVLTGVQISDYRLEEREAAPGRLRGLCDLVRDILERTDLPRLRLTSIAPWDLDRELLELFQDGRLCRHLHLSLQSGSTSVLRRMRRPYTGDQFERAVELARSMVPPAAITTDVIVGFPGESDVEFRDSLFFVERMNFARVHVFPYSARQGTLAAALPLQVPDAVKDERARAMQQVADESLHRFASRFVGQTLPVLYEEQAAAPGVWSGYTDNYIRVTTRCDRALGNRIADTRLVEVVEGGARGELDASALPESNCSPIPAALAL